MKEYVYWKIRHDVFGEIDPKTKWFRISGPQLSLKQMDACQQANKSLDYSPAIGIFIYADKKTAISDLKEIRKYLTKKAARKFHLVKVHVKRSR
jgi:hypothetical protein